MKSKQEILQALAKSDEDRLLLANLMDKEQAGASRGYLTHTRFLDMRERALCAEAIRLMGVSDHAVLWGGYEESERVIAVFFPEYMTETEAREASPLVLLRAHKSENDSLTHRDYLGALMGLKIERNVIGDILVHDTGADLIVLEEMADFIQLNFDKAGRKRIRISREPMDALCLGAQEQTEGKGSVASARLDSVTALVFGLSRSEAQIQIAKGLVFLNSEPCLKDEREVRENDRITLRGKGRAKITSFGGVSKKGRLFLTYVKSK